MAFLTLEDMYGSKEIIVFPRAFERYRSLLKKDAKLLITGKASVSEEEAKLILSKAVSFDDMPKDVWLQYETKEQYNQLEKRLYEIIDAYPGSSGVKIYIKNGKLRKDLPAQFGIQVKHESESLLTDMLGEGNVIIKDRSRI